MNVTCLSWMNPFLTYSIVILPEFDVSIDLKAYLISLKSIVPVILLTKNLRVSI